MSGASAPATFEDPDAIADAIIGRVGRKIVLALPLGLGKANHIANALFARAANDPSIELRIFTALTLEKPRAKQELERRFLEPINQRLFGGYPGLAYAVAIRRGQLPPNIQVNEFFFEAGQWIGVPQAQQSYISANYTHALRYVLDRGVNVIAQLVARQGSRYSLSSNPDLTLDLLDLRRSGACNFVFAGQVNTELPFMPGDGDLGAEHFDFMLDSPQTDFSLFAPPREPVTLTDYAIGLHAASTVPDGGTLQLGIGSLGDGIAQALIVRDRNNAAFKTLLKALAVRPVAPSLSHTEPFSRGLYACSEMFVDAFFDLFKAGILKREVDGAALHAAFFVGSRAFYRGLREMPREDLAKLQMMPVSFVNELYGDEAAKRKARVGARFINNAMMATLLGHAISDGLDNGQVISGVGGQYNFVAQSFALDDARSLIALRSTRRSKRQTTSNIRWNYAHTTIPRHLRDIVVTEYGVADLRGKTDRDVIAEMLSITDSRYQDSLLREAKDAGKIEKDFVLPKACRDNSPERIERTLRSARDSDLLPRFPFGTDFTETEQRLLPALEKMADASLPNLLRLFVKGIGSGVTSEQTREALARMKLDRPSAPVDRFYKALLLGALE